MSLAGDGVGSAAALSGGYHLAWLVGAATIIVTLALAMSALRARTATELEADLSEDEQVA
jgi:hypothetical protein